MPVKILAKGELERKNLTVSAHAFSAAAKEKIEAAGGTCTVIEARGDERRQAMIATIANAFSVPEIRRKLLFTAAILALYRLGAYIPVPGIDVDAVKDARGHLRAARTSSAS